MVAPLLLGILGAGLATGAGVTAARDWRDRRRGERLGGILDSLPEGANTDDARRAIAVGGLLDPARFAEIGFNDAESHRDFLEQIALTTTQYDLADRNNARSSARSRSNALATAGTEAQLAALEQFNALGVATEEAIAPFQTRGNRITGIVSAADSLGPAGLVAPMSALSPDQQATRMALEQAESEMFYDWLFETYGDREPNPATLEEFQRKYGTFTTAGGLFSTPTTFNGTRTLYESRLQEVNDQVSTLLGEYDVKVNRLLNPTEPITPRAPAPFTLPSNPRVALDPSTVPGGIADDQPILAVPPGPPGTTRQPPQLEQSQPTMTLPNQGTQQLTPEIALYLYLNGQITAEQYEQITRGAMQ